MKPDPRARCEAIGLTGPGNGSGTVFVKAARDVESSTPRAAVLEAPAGVGRKSLSVGPFIKVSPVEGRGDAQGAPHPDASELVRQARKRAGVMDFGLPEVDTPLSVLMKSLAEEAKLHRLGRFLAHVHLRDLLEIRLRLVDAWKRGSGTKDEPVRQPVFVTGMPRSGSTFFHELLSLDSLNRAPRVWEVMYPLRRPGGALQSDAGKIWRAETNLWWFRRLAPQADSVYPMRARTPHECVAIHSYTLMSQEFVSSFNVPSYEAFLDAADFAPTYAWEKRFLQYLQAGEPERRWVLKSPDHVRSLEALWQVFPDAFVIQTHRHPLETLVSSSHLTEVLRRMFSRPQNRQDIGRREAQLMADNMTRIMSFRDAHPEFAGRFIDVHYHELVADPVATLRRVYERMGAVLTEDTIHRVRQLAAARKRYAPHRNGHPTLAELGLDPHIEAERFGHYCARFEIPPAGTR